MNSENFNQSLQSSLLDLKRGRDHASFFVYNPKVEEQVDKKWVVYELFYYVYRNFSPETSILLQKIHMTLHI